MRPDCRVRVEQILGRKVSPAEAAEIDGRLARSRAYLQQQELLFKDLPKTEQLKRAGAHAAELRRAEAEDLVRAFDLDFRLREAGRLLLGDADFDALLKSGRLRFMDRASDLPQFRNGADDDAVAVTLDDGRVVIFRDNAGSGAMQELLLHELGVHAGLRGYLGDAAFRDLLADVSKALANGEDGALRAAMRVPADTPGEAVLEEVLAYWVQFADFKTGFWPRLIDRMRAGIYKAVPALRGRMKLTDGMLVEMARGAMWREVGLARKLVQAGKTLRHVPLEASGAGRFARGPMSREAFEAEMRKIRKDWDPADIDRAYALHVRHVQAREGAQVPPADGGLRRAAEVELEKSGGPGDGLIEESEAMEASIRERLDLEGIDPERTLVFDPETEREVPLARVLQDLDEDRKMLDRLRGCAYPGGKA